MRIVGTEHADPGQVHTIDMWFSQRRGGWIVERLDVDGHPVGTAHVCRDEQDAAVCLEHWLRAHAETHLVGLSDRPRLAKTVSQRRHAA